MLLLDVNYKYYETGFIKYTCPNCKYGLTAVNSAYRSCVSCGKKLPNIMELFNMDKTHALQYHFNETIK